MQQMALDALSDVSDDALMVLYANGDMMAGRALALRLTPRLMGYAARLLGDRTEAEDVTQEAMLRLWRIAPEWRQGEARITTWLYKVVSNLCVDRLRRGQHSSLEAAADAEAPDPPVFERMIETDRVSALEAALKLLPERQRQAVILRHLEELGNAEISGVMEIGIEAVESLVARGKRNLSAILSGRSAELGYGEDG
jgi:RNA polymerase sigma factor (sigma-70 family)